MTDPTPQQMTTANKLEAAKVLFDELVRMGYAHQEFRVRWPDIDPDYPDLWDPETDWLVSGSSFDTLQQAQEYLARSKHEDGRIVRRVVVEAEWEELLRPAPVSAPVLVRRCYRYTPIPGDSRSLEESGPCTLPEDHEGEWHQHPGGFEWRFRPAPQTGMETR